MPLIGPPPNLTTTQRDALVVADRPKGTIVYNTTTGRLEVNDGTGAAPTWNAVGGNAAQYGTALPTASLANGQLFTLYVNTGSNYVAWQCMYRVDLDATYPWHVIGGPPYHVAAASTTLPRSGRYVFMGKSWLGSGGTSSGGSVGGILTLGGSTIDTTNASGVPGASSGTGTRGFANFNFEAEAAAAAGTSLAMTITDNFGSAVAAVDPHLSLLPTKII